MAEIKSDNYTDVPVSSTFGNVASHLVTATLAAAAIADEVQLCELPAGTQLTDLHAVIAAMGGTGGTISFGWKYKSGAAGGGAAALEAAASVDTASDVRGTFVPVTLTEKAVLTATVAGDAATGALNVVFTSVQTGTL